MESHHHLILVVVISLTVITTTTVTAQKLCQFRNSIEDTKLNNWNFIESFSLRTCFLVENFGHFPNRKILLHECSYGSKALREQKVYLVKSQLGGFHLKVDPGMGNEMYCLTLKNGLVQSAECRSNSFEQTWKFKPVRNYPNQYLIENYGTHECLIPTSRRIGATVGTKPCNAFETEQIWKICTQSGSDP